jgi:hypothetical protein
MHVVRREARGCAQGSMWHEWGTPLKLPVVLSSCDVRKPALIPDEVYQRRITMLGTDDDVALGIIVTEAKSTLVTRSVFYRSGGGIVWIKNAAKQEQFDLYTRLVFVEPPQYPLAA